MSVLNARKSSVPLGRDQSGSYQRIRFVTPNIDATNIYASATETPYRISGDHITCVKINGPGVIQIRLGRDNPWIPIMEGMTVQRAFEEIWVRDVNLYTGKSIPGTEAVFYASFGPFLTIPFKPSGLRPTPFVGNATLVAGTIYTLEDMVALFLAPANMEFAGDLTGAAFLIRVSQNANTGAQLLFGEVGTLAFAANAGYQLFPGEWVAIEQAGKMGRILRNTTAPATTKFSWHIAPLAAGLTTNVNFIVGYRTDMSDSDFTNDIESTIPRRLDMGG